MRFPLALPLACVAIALVGCDTVRLTDDRTEQSVWRDDITAPLERNIRLDVNEAVHVLRAERGRLALGEAGRLGAFLAAQGAPWSMDVQVQPLSPKGEAALPEVAEILGRLGVQPERMLLAAAGARAGDGDIAVTLRNIRASASGCPDWRRSNLMDLSELNSSNFGCATADNLARMIADPRELSTGRALAPANGANATGALERYRTDRVKPLLDREGGGGIGGGGGGSK